MRARLCLPLWLPIALSVSACARPTTPPPSPSPIPSPTLPATAMPAAPTLPPPSPSPVPSPTPPATATGTSQPSDALRGIPGAQCLPPGRPVEIARPVRVIDGDTLDVAIGGQTVRVRYIGINAPERDQAFYAEATAAHRRLVEGKTLYLVRDVSETDRYGRLLRYVIAGDIFVNRALVEEGYAQAMTTPPDVSCAEAFRAAEAEARSAGRGLWGIPAPTPTPMGAPPPSGRNCHPAYPTVCIPPPPPDLDCKDIPYRNFPVDHRYGDPHRFDRDNDGIGCER